jgi:endonuclease YncB( thermonuclease family)
VDGERWTVEAIVKLTDGDTLRVRRSRVVNLDGRHFRQTDVKPDGTPGDVAIRLTWVDTPEKGQPGWAEARADLQAWLSTAVIDGLTVVCYAHGGFERLLGDLYDATGQSASEYLMTQGNGGAGWPPYEKS